MKVLGLGNALVDVLVQLDNDAIVKTLGYPKGSMQLINAEDIPNITQYIEDIPAVMVSGGSAANTIHGLASLGTATGYMGKIGPDELGEFYSNDLKKAGVACTLLPSETVTGRAYTLITPDTERTFATYLGAAVEMLPEELDESIFKNYDMLHIEGYLVFNTGLIERALQLAKKNGLKVSLDLASFNVVEANLEFLQRAIPRYVDIIFANEEEAKAFTGQEPADALLTLSKHVEIAVVKVGKEGSMIRTGGATTQVGIIPVQALDTTGAGDQYAAGFLFGLSVGAPMEQCGKLGALLAGTVIADYGARIPEKLWGKIRTEATKILK